MKGMCLGVLLLLTAPGAAGAAGSKAPKTYVHLTTRQWFTLDPSAAYDSVSFIITGNVYEPLITFKDVRKPDKLMPFLAEKVPTRRNGLVSEDGTVYTFPIRKGVFFHSGDPLTPEDVRYSILRFMLHDMRMGSSLLLKPILGVYSTRDAGGKLQVDFHEAAEAVRVRGGSVVVRLKKPDSTFLKALASLPIIVSKRWCSINGEWDGSERTWLDYNKRHRTKSYLHAVMNGTGPFRLEKADRKAGVVVLRRSKRYWRKPAELERVVLKVVPSPALRLWMLENGDADGSYFEDRDYRDAKSLKNVRIRERLPYTSLGEMLFFTFHADPSAEFLGSGRLDGKGIPPDFFADRDIREGFARALDYAGYYRRGMGGRGRRALGPFPEQLFRYKKKDAYEFDPQGAEAAFRRAQGGRLWEKGFTVTLAYSPSNVHRAVLAELLMEALKKINPGFKLLIRPIPSSELYSALGDHKLPLFISSFYSDYPDPQSFAFGLLHSRGYNAEGQGYSDPEMDRLSDEARSTMDAKKRRAVYRRMVELARRDLPQVYTYQPARFRALHKRVKELDPRQNVSNLGFNNYPYFYALTK